VLLALCALSCAAAAATAPAIAAQPEWYVNFKLAPTTGGVPVVAWGELRLVVAGETITCKDVMSGSVWNENGRGAGQIEGFGAGACTPFHENLCEVETREEPCNHQQFITSEMPFEKELVEGETCIESSKKTLSQCPGPSERTEKSLIRHFRRRPPSFPWNMRLASGIREEEPVTLLEIGNEGSACYPTETKIVEGKETQVPASWEKVPAGCIRLDLLIPETGVEVPVYGAISPQLLNGSGSGLNPSRLSFALAGHLEVEEAPGTFSQAELTGTAKILGAEGRELLVAR
jgi:hypothetical protein